MSIKSKILVAVAATMIVSVVQATEVPVKDPAKFLAAMQQIVGGQLKDPMSAQYRNLHQYSGHGDKAVYCGEVNSKNSFGGYTGFEMFIVDGNSETTLIGQYSPTDGSGKAPRGLGVEGVLAWAFNDTVEKLCN
jgi:hypothetical protein